MEQKTFSLDIPVRYSELLERMHVLTLRRNLTREERLELFGLYRRRFKDLRRPTAEVVQLIAASLEETRTFAQSDEEEKFFDEMIQNPRELFDRRTGGDRRKIGAGPKDPKLLQFLPRRQDRRTHR